MDIFIFTGELLTVTPNMVDENCLFSFLGYLIYGMTNRGPF